MRLYRRLHILSWTLRIFLVLVVFSVLLVPSRLFFIVLELIPMNSTIAAILAIFGLIAGFGFAIYGTYKIYKMIPSDTWNKIDESMFSISDSSKKK